MAKKKNSKFFQNWRSLFNQEQDTKIIQWKKSNDYPWKIRYFGLLFKTKKKLYKKVFTKSFSSSSRSIHQMTILGFKLPLNYLYLKRFSSIFSSIEFFKKKTLIDNKRTIQKEKPEKNVKQPHYWPIDCPVFVCLVWHITSLWSVTVAAEKLLCIVVWLFHLDHFEWNNQPDREILDQKKRR